jgi:hypothetical protein
MKYDIKNIATYLLNKEVVYMKTEKTVLIDNKGVSEILGVILIFGIMVFFLGILQSVFVPEWDREIEEAHFNNIYDDTLYLRQVIQETAIFNLYRTTLFHASLDYPTRIFLYNPSKPGATISTFNDEQKQIRIYHDDGYELVNSCTIQIKENYNYFSAPELIMEHGMIIGNNGQTNYTIDGPPMNNETRNLYLVECSNNSIGTTSSLNIHLIPESDISVNNVSSITFRTNYQKLWIAYLNSSNVNYGKDLTDGIIIYYNNATIRILNTNIKV